MHSNLNKFLACIATVIFLTLITTSLPAATLTWNSIGPQSDSQIASLVIDPSNNSILYAGTAFNNGVYKSENGGVDWIPINTGLPAISTTYMLSIDPSNPTTLYVCTTEDGVFKSTNGGENWIPMNNGLTDIRIHSPLIIDPTNTSTIYVGTEGGVFKSINGGASWFFSNSGLVTGEINLQAIDSLNPSVLYAADHYSEGNSEGGLFKSINGGESWFSVNNGLPSTTSPESEIYSVAVDPSNSQVVYAGSNGGGVYKSTNGGENWSAVNNCLTNKVVYGIAIDPSNPATLFVGTEAGMFISNNNGENWFSVGLTDYMVIPIFDPTDPSILFAGTFGGGILKSDVASITIDFNQRCSIDMSWLLLLLDDDDNKDASKDFTGTYNFSEQFDNNISNGVTLDLSSVALEVTKTNTNTINLNGTVTNPEETYSYQLPLVVKDNTATLLAHPYPIPGGSGNLLEFLLLSDGNNMVYTAVGQEHDVPTDISLGVANWLKTPNTVTTDSFVGNWSGIFYTDPNLRNTTDGFNLTNQSGVISKVDANTISIIIDNEPLLLDVVNNRATLANAPVTTSAAVYHAISIVTDGIGLSWYLVATELSDPTDVAVDIGLMTKQ